MTVTVIRSILLAVGLLMLTLAALQDLRSRIVPNALVILVAITGLLLGVLTRPPSLWVNVVVAVLVVVAFGALSHLDSFGGGDIKLMAASTFLVSPSHIAGLLVAIALAGGVVSLIYIALRYALRNRARRDTRHRRRNALALWWRHERARIADGRTIPYAVAISGGSISYIIAEWHRCLSATSCSL